VRVARRVPIEEVPALARAIDDAAAELDSRGRILVRYSGTEPLLRTLVEGVDGQQVASLAERLERVVKEQLA